MFAKKIWIPIVCCLIGFAIGGTFLGQHIANQEPVKVINVVTPEPVDRSQPTQAETQPAAEGGHFHGDEWHAQPHEPVLPSGGLQSDGVWYPDNYTPADIAADLAGLPAEPGEEYHRRAMKHAVNVYIQKHQKAYPDCTEKQAVIDDAKRFAAWQLADQAYMDKYRQLTTERDRSRNEMTRLLEKYNYSPAHEATHIPESERLNDVERIKSLMAEIEAYGKRNDALNLENPPYPKPLHTH